MLLINAHLVGKPADKLYSVDIAGGVIVATSPHAVVDVEEGYEVIDLEGMWVSPVRNPYVPCILTPSPSSTGTRTLR